ncbi:peptidoglycan DD-metalloendopeptidase family protein [Candidatus Nomurabacteria bacterium]|nr:peptidoglycan DD-metalloendopeptidase family protein [Candidatus Nomurabacteria bacterium]
MSNMKMRIKRAFKLAFQISALVLFILFSLNTPPADVISPVARAISECDKFAIDKGSILADNELCQPCTDNTDNAISKKVFVIGDSLTKAMRDDGQMQAKLESRNFEVTKIEGNNGFNINDSLPLIDSDANEISQADIVVIGLGTNPEPNFGQKVPEMITKVKQKAPNAQIFWTNVHVQPGAYIDPSFLGNNRINQILETKSQSEGFTVIDWDKEVTDNPNPYPFLGDGVHHTPEGSVARSDFIASALPQSEDPSEPSGTGSTQELASQMISNGNITYWENNGVNTRDVVVALSEGRKAFTTSNDPLAVENREVDINPNILSFILEAAKTGPIMVNALTDKDHSSNSNHYKGKAVDLQNSGPNTQAVSVYDAAAQKFGGVRNSETTHWHYDFTSDATAIPVGNNNDTANPSCCSNSGGTGTLTGANNEEKIFNYLSSGKGINAIQAAGIMGNMKMESSFNPTALESGGTGRGLVQWSFGRRTNLETAATAANVDLSIDDDANILFQLDYMINESKGRDSITFDGVKEWDGLARTTRVDTFDETQGSTIYWEANFERPKNPGQKSRIDAAIDIMTRLGGGGGGGGGVVTQVSTTTQSNCPGAGSSMVCEGNGTVPLPDGIDITFFNSHNHHQSVSYPGGSNRHRPLLGNFGAYGTESVTKNGPGTGEAVDVGAPPGTAVLAPVDGKVTYSDGVSGRGDSDKAVVIESTNKKCAATLAHMQPTVSEGDMVTAGQEIGTLTNMANSHLHFELWVDGEPINIGPDSSPCGLGEDPCDNFSDEAEQIWNKQKEALTNSAAGASDVISL